MYISTREMVISIICNACGVLGLILWAIEAHKSNATQCIQGVESVKSVENNGDIIVRSNLEPFRVADTPQTLPKDIVQPCGNGNVMMSEDTYEELLQTEQTDCPWK